MSNLLKAPGRIRLVALFFGLTGCFPATLPTLEAPPALSRLNELADANISFTVDSAPVEGHRGYQFLTVLPVTRVYTPDIDREVSDQLSIQAGLKGYRLVPTDSAKKPSYSLSVTVEDLTVSGYCYLLVRRPHSDIRLKGVIRSPDGTVVRECSGSGEATYTAKFAFADELNEARRIALTQAAVELVACLELPKPRAVK